MSRTPEERFWEKVQRGDGCWEWQASLRPNGYGQFGWAAGDIRYSHRTAWELTHGPIPAGLYVCHRCDNPACCNPRHLFLGTASENQRDKVTKGRQRGGARKGVRRRRIPDADVQRIREQCATGDSQRALARTMGVSATHVGRIAKGLVRVA